MGLWFVGKLGKLILLSYMMDSSLQGWDNNEDLTNCPGRPRLCIVEGHGLWKRSQLNRPSAYCPELQFNFFGGSEFTSLSLVHLIYTIGITSPIWEYYNSKRFYHMCVHQHIESVKWTAITPPLKLFKEEGSPSLGLSIIRLFKIEEWDMNYFYSIALISFYWFVEK